MILSHTMIALALLAPLSVSASQVPLPPKQHQGDVTATVHFVSPERVTELCGGAVKGKIVVACATASPPQMAVPNPCSFPGETYARILCHETGHVAGWTKGHA
jgi:hypothetical protein